MIGSDLLIIGKIYLVSLVLQLISWPTTKAVFDKLTDKGWPVSRLITTLIAGLVVWQFGHLGLAANTDEGLMAVTGLITGLNCWWWLKKKNKSKLHSETLKLIVIEEYLFVIGLFGISLARGFLPNIDGLEKFMDYGFVKMYLVSPTLPAIDMWQANSPINYYSFGHFWASELIRFFMVEPAVGYNLVLGYIAGLTMSIAFSVSYLLSGTKKVFVGVMAGLIGALATALASNGHVLWYLITKKTILGYWYADATRFIHNTIHEFPGYSFVVADLHGHLLGLPMVLLFVLLFLVWLKSRKLIFEILMGVLLGVMMMTNTWDLAIYGLALIVAGVQTLVTKPKDFFGLLRAAIIIGVSLAITALPWFVSFESIASGVKMVTERSPLWQLAVLWAGGIAIMIVTVVAEGKGENKLPIRTLVITAILLIIIPEFIYAKDIYPDHPRANTMFKLTYQASVMIGLLSGSLWGKLLDMDRLIFWGWRTVGLLVAGVFFAGTMVYPTASFPNFYLNFETYRGLNGETWMATKMPEKYGAIKYLQENRDDKNLAEAVGDSYTEFNAVSVFSGIPTIQGWRVHEWLWRGGYTTVAERESEVRALYETEDKNKREEIIKKYNIGWVLVGVDEKVTYSVMDQEIKRLGKVVYENGGTYLVKVN